MGRLFFGFIHCWGLRLDPRQFGHPNSRPRSWRICYRQGKKRWASKSSLQELADQILASMTSELKLDYSCYLIDDQNSLGATTESSLTEFLRSSESTLFFYVVSKPHPVFQVFYDFYVLVSSATRSLLARCLRSQASHLQMFRATCPNHELYDLSANVHKRRRVELKKRTGMVSEKPQDLEIQNASFGDVQWCLQDVSMPYNKLLFLGG